MRKILRPILIFLAIIFLIEAWLWDRLEPIVARVVGLIPLERIKAALSEWIVGLPPAGTFVVFLVPMALAVPFKVAGIWLLANGDLSAALGVLIAAKFITLAVTAFVFDVTRDKLLQLDWFKILYDYVILLRARAEDLLNPIKRRIRYRMRLLLPQRSQRGFRLFRRIRRRMHAEQPTQESAADAGLPAERLPASGGL